MKLIYNPASPYVRKVMVLAHELKLADRIELISETVLPHKPNAAVAGSNPLMKVPTLLLDDGSALFDSRVIVEYLDVLAGGKFIPATGPQRWVALRLQALADGVLDAAVLIRYERALRPAEKQWADWIDGQLLKIRQGLDALEAQAGSSSTVTIGDIAAACALGYLDFRFPDENWRATHPRLAAFYERFSARPSMLATRPPA
jgi:glutathione S-transferase